MSKQEARLILIILFAMQVIWLTGYVIVGDFYPEMRTMEKVFCAKSIANGIACFFGLAIYVGESGRFE